MTIMIKSRTAPGAIQLIDIDAITKSKITVEVKERTGFDFFSVVFKPCTPISGSTVYATENYSDDWKMEYCKSCFWKQDPILQYRYSTFREGAVWNDRFFGSSRELWRKAQEHDLRAGVSFLISLSDSPMRVVLSLSSHDVKDIKKSEVNFLYDNVAHHIAHSVMDAVKERMDGYGGLSSYVPLSVRETDVLRFSADGLTSTDISENLHVTRSTVHFHMRNIKEKLGCRNKTQAVAKAVLLGYI